MRRGWALGAYGGSSGDFDTARGPPSGGWSGCRLSTADLYESRLSVHYLVLFIIYVLTGTCSYELTGFPPRREKL
jgi:hypothetical protein